MAADEFLRFNRSPYVAEEWLRVLEEPVTPGLVGLGRRKTAIDELRWVGDAAAIARLSRIADRNPELAEAVAEAIRVIEERLSQ